MESKNIVGKRFENITVKELDYTEEKIYNGKLRRNYFYKCICDCGNEISVVRNNIVNGHTKSCGCLKSKHLDITGKTYNRLTVIKFDHIEERKNRKNGKVYFYLCQCNCGKFTILSEHNIRHGAVKSCGCFGVETKIKNGLEMGEKNKEKLKKDLYEHTHVSFIKNPSKMNRPNPSGIRGVIERKNGTLYEAHITVNKVYHYLGSYNTKEEAAQARQNAEEKLVGNLKNNINS